MADDEIQRARIAPQHITPGKARGTLKVSLPLSPAPDQAWAKCFVQPFTSYFPWTSNPGHSGLEISRGSIEFVTTEQSLDEALADVDRKIAGTNKWYLGEYLPARRAQKEALDAREREQARELERIRDKFTGK
jgi:hypothetical protein